MRYRKFGRLGWLVSEIGYGMWGIANGEGGWTGAREDTRSSCLHTAVDLGCNFFDTAWIYGRGHSERMLGQLLSERTDRRLYTATKIPPKNREWPSKRSDRFSECFPIDYLERSLEQSLSNLRVSRIDLLQFHVWEDGWAQDETWMRVADDWKREGLISGIGISVNRWEPWNVLETLRTGAIDAVQVIYNIFDQAPEDELFPLCRDLEIATIARVPFDEGTLTGDLTLDSRWPAGDWRNSYFVPENLNECVPRAEALRSLVPNKSTMAEMALGFILSNLDVSTTIPGMRQLAHVRRNLAVSDAGPLSEDLLKALRAHRWDRQPTEWSQ